MPVKSPRAKKPTFSPEIHRPETEEDVEVIDLRSQTSKKPVDFDLGDSGLGEEDSKEDVPIPTDDSDELSVEDTALDEEELNPFGDKWEM